MNRQGGREGTDLYRPLTIMVERDVATLTTILVSPADNANVEATPKAKRVTDMNTQVGYIICVHRAATGIFGPMSKPLDGKRRARFLYAIS